MSENINEKWISIEEAAEHLGIKPVTVRDWIKKGKGIPANKKEKKKNTVLHIYMFDFCFCISTKSLFEYYVIYFISDNYVYGNRQNKECIWTKYLIKITYYLSVSA